MEKENPTNFEPTPPCSEKPEIYAEKDVPPYEEEFTLSGGCCSGS